MTTHEQIIAAAIQADSGFSGGPDYDGTMEESIIGMAAVERFFDIAFGDGAASRDVEIAELRHQLATFHSAVEHVTEDGCRRRSFVAIPEGWAMVHKDRLHDLELAEEQLAATDGLDQYILCEKEPVVWMQSDHLFKFVHHACGAQAALVRCSDYQLMPDFQPLYRAMKVLVAREKNAKNC